MAASRQFTLPQQFISLYKSAHRRWWHTTHHPQGAAATDTDGYTIYDPRQRPCRDGAMAEGLRLHSHIRYVGVFPATRASGFTPRCIFLWGVVQYTIHVRFISRHQTYDCLMIQRSWLAPPPCGSESNDGWVWPTLYDSYYIPFR